LGSLGIAGLEKFAKGGGETKQNNNDEEIG
jgi:hypothetical protein